MIILFAHGSPDPRHRAGVAAVAAQVAQVLAPAESVRVAYLQHHGPTLLDAVAGVPRRSGAPERSGVRPAGSTPAPRVWVLPLLLSDGVHVTEDVPAAVVAAGLARPDVDWRLLPTLPPATLALAVLALLPRPERRASGRLRGVVGVVAGSSRPAALTAFEALAAALRPADVELVIANGPGPGVGQAADLLSALGADDVTVVPLMFADGVLVARAAEAAADLGLPSTAPLGTTLECGEALAAWVAAHVRRDTSASRRRVSAGVDAAP